nr:MAG: hypothetical protein 2 [Enamovirus sp.]
MRLTGVPSLWLILAGAMIALAQLTCCASQSPCYGATPGHPSGDLAALSNPLSSTEGLCSCRLQPLPVYTDGSLHKLDLFIPNLTRGEEAGSRHPPGLMRPLLLVQIGQWLVLERRNTTLHFSLQIPMEFLLPLPPYEDLLDEFVDRAQCLFSSSFSTIMDAPRLIIACIGNCFLAIADLLELAFASWLVWLTSAIWYIVRVSPTRTLTWSALGLICFSAWENRFFRATIRLVFLPVLVTALIIKTCYLNILLCALRLISLKMSILRSCSSLVVRVAMLPFQTMKSILTMILHCLMGATHLLSRMEQILTEGPKDELIPGRPNFSQCVERATPLSPNQKFLSLPAKPPKSCIGHVLTADEVRIGYFTHVKLMGGERAILVPAHLLEDAAFFGGSTALLPTTYFTEQYRDAIGDLVLLTGPGVWSSVLGLKAAILLPADFARVASYSLYFQREAEWFVQPVQVIGAKDGFLRVVSQTTPGFSGLPIFDERNRVIAVHVGHFGDRATENRASVILPIPGFTAPDSAVYRFAGRENESLYVKDKLLTISEDIEDAVLRRLTVRGEEFASLWGEKGFSSVKSWEEHLKSGNPAGKLWADYEDDELESSVPRSGNGSTQSTLGNQSVVAPVAEVIPAPVVVPTETVIPPVAPPTPLAEKPAPVEQQREKLTRAQRIARMTPEQLAIFRAGEAARRKARRARKSAAKPATVHRKVETSPPSQPILETVAKEVWKSLDLPAIAKEIKSIVREEMAQLQQRQKPPRSRPSSAGSTTGTKVKSAPKASQSSAPAPSVPLHRPLKVCPRGEKTEFRPRRSYKPAVKPTGGPAQEPKRN